MKPNNQTIEVTVAVNSAKEAKQKFDAFQTLYGGQVTASIIGAWKNTKDQYFNLWTRAFEENTVISFGTKKVLILGYKNRKCRVAPAPAEDYFRDTAYLKLRNY
jgi:hypothetical protein